MLKKITGRLLGGYGLDDVASRVARAGTVLVFVNVDVACVVPATVEED